MVPYGIEGTIKEIKAGEFTVEETVAVVETKDGDKELTLCRDGRFAVDVRIRKNFRRKCPLLQGSV